MAVYPAAGFHIGNCGQRAVGDVFVEIDRVFQVLGADGGVGHDLRLVLERIADVAVLIAGRADRTVVQLVFVAEVGVPLVAVVFPGDARFKEHVGDAALVDRRNGERGVEDVVVGIGVGAIAKVARVVIIEQIVVAGIAVGIDRALERSEIVAQRAGAGRIQVGAVTVRAAACDRLAEATAAIAVFRVPVVGAGLRVWIFDFIHGAFVGSALIDDLVVRRRAC